MLFSSKFRRQSSDVEYHGISANKRFITAVIPQNVTASLRYYRKIHGENPWYYRGYRGITAVPITVQLSNLEPPMISFITISAATVAWLRDF